MNEERKLTQEYAEFEIVRLNNNSEIDIINIDKSSSINLKSGTYFLIRKLFKTKVECSLNRESLYFNLEDELKIYYRKICDVSEVSPGKISMYFLPLDSLPVDRYSNYFWSAKCQKLWFKKRQDVSEIHFAPTRPYEIEKKLCNKGLGSYLIDSIVTWAKTNYSDATITITINPIDKTTENIDRVRHFYAKRKIERGQKLGDTLTFLNSNKFEIIPIDEFVHITKNHLSDNFQKIYNQQRHIVEVNDMTLFMYKNNKTYKICIAILSLMCLILVGFIFSNR